MTRRTMEGEWEAWAPLAALRALSPPIGRVVVISAHPDDEVLGAGGVIASLAGTAAQLSFVTVTDGEASHPGAPITRSELAARRLRELAEALTELGHPRAHITRLKLPDSGLASQRDVLAGLLRRITAQADLVLCPAAIDGHIDHETVGSLTLDVCRDRVPVWQYPIWMWHWTLPGDNPERWARAGRVDIPADIAARKRAALQCFSTQIAPLDDDDAETVILPPNVLAHFERSYEVFFT